MSELLDSNLKEAGVKLAQAYLDFLAEWKFNLTREQPLQTIKSFIIVLSGCETAQRVNESSVTFVMMDAEKIWRKEQIKEILEGALEYLKATLHVESELAIDFIDILGEREIGKYFCAKCGMFFEFGMKRETVTCPLMAQKSMFDPQHIEKVKYPDDKFIKQFEITPDIYKKMIASIGNNKDLTEKVKALLQEWKISDKEIELLNLLK
jgi:hypothetical protein